MTRPATLAEKCQAALLRLVFALFGALPLDHASAVGGWIGRTIGPRLGVSRRARRNFDIALPDLTEPQRREIIRAMWDNLGRVAAEYPHLTEIRCFGPGARVEVLGTEHVDTARAANRPIMLVSGHFGNWEVGCLAALQYGLEVAQIYRAANNPAIEAIMLALRQGLGVDPIAKGASGARRIIGAIRAGRTVAMLIDQKMNDGIPVPFFGRIAMTAPAAAELALRYDCAILPCRVERLNGARFRVTVSAALKLPHSGDRHADIAATMAQLNRQLEAWVRDAPAQWFWLHRRWPES